MLARVSAPAEHRPASLIRARRRRSTKLDGDRWAHEIKHDGYRIQIHVTSAGVKLYTMTGYDWTDRYPLIVEAAAKIKGTAIIDAEAVVAHRDGFTDVEAIHDREHDDQVQAFAFHLMMRDGNGPAVYAASCRMGLEGIVSKLVDAPYRSGRSKAWVKVKNPDAPAMLRLRREVEPLRPRPVL
jgi:ATP-dependent DNA ligase